MFQFTRFATLNLYIQLRLTLMGRVSPFGHLRITACLPAPRSFSQASTSFIACNRQGIHHMHLFTWSYNFKTFIIILQEMIKILFLWILLMLNSNLHRWYNLTLIHFKFPWSCPNTSKQNQFTSKWTINTFQIFKEQNNTNFNSKTLNRQNLTTQNSRSNLYLLPHLAINKLVEVNGIEPMTPCLQSRCSPSWATPPLCGGSGWIRTNDPRLIKTVL